MTSQATASRITRETLAATLEARIEVVLIGVPDRLKAQIRNNAVLAGQRILEFYDDTNGSLPQTLGELASLQIGTLTRLKSVALEINHETKSTETRVDDWTIRDFFTKSVGKSDQNLLRTPNFGVAALGLYHFIKIVYGELGQLDLLTSSMAAAWQQCAAQLAKMNTAEKLSLLLFLEADVATANKPVFLSELRQAARQYYSGAIIDEQLEQTTHQDVTRRLVEVLIANADQKDRMDNPDKILFGDTKPISGIDLGRLGLLRSHITVIHADAINGYLDEVELRLRLVGSLAQRFQGNFGRITVEPQTQSEITAAAQHAASTAIEKFVDAGRIKDAIDVMAVFDNDIADRAVVTDNAFTKLLQGAINESQTQSLLGLQERIEILQTFATNRAELSAFTEAQQGLLSQLSDTASQRRATMRSDFARRIAAASSDVPKK